MKVATQKPPEPKEDANALVVSDISTGSRELITYIIPDFKAVKYFEKEFLATNDFHLSEETEASGFDIYIVDQWITSRKIGTVISTFTGNFESKVKVIKFTIIKKPSKQYPSRFQEYLNEVMLNHATFKKMDSGKDAAPNTSEDSAISEFLFVTNTSALPSNLNLIPIPDGDTRPVESKFMINSNLKKLNCGGRSLSLIADKVSDASEDKFRQMYKVYNGSVPIKFAIKELVNLIQTCLFYFDLLDARYCDGLLCQKTEDAINNWWNLIGLPHFNIKPNPKTGILPAKTVAAIISLTLSVKMRLQLVGGCDVPKDPFDFENFMISIGQFQKQVKIEKKRKLDLLTLLKLFYFTNQKVSADSTKFHGFDSTLSFDDNNDSASMVPSKTNPLLYSPNSFANLSASTYRRNKIYYSKELKKLTNVVKNTVQDHIIVREDDDGFFNNALNTASGARVRNKITSKLAENVTPAEVETLDLEVLVRKFLVGKTLVRLWQGLSAAPNPVSGKADENGLTGAHNHRHYHHANGLSSDTAQLYQFQSLRDSVTLNQELSSVQGDRTGRLGRMRFAFQGRRANSFQNILQMFSEFTRESLDKITCNDVYNADSLLDAELRKISGLPFSTQIPCNKIEACADIRKKQPFRCSLNRRNSFPFSNTGAEMNLNTVEFLRNENYVLSTATTLQSRLGRSASFSNLEDYFHGCNQLHCEAKASHNYITQVANILRLEHLRKTSTGNERIAKAYKQMNFELVKLQNVHSQMEAKRAIIDADYSSVLIARMRDLADNIDRMAFRSRDLLKKISELDDNSRTFEHKLKSECFKKLEDTIEHLIHTTKFRNVFKDDEERLKLVFQLTGRDVVVEEDKEEEGSFLFFRMLVVFLYDMMVFLLQVFNFDRSKMNLDRIRESYRRLDPNRMYIDKAYNFVGRDPLSLTRASVSEPSDGHSAD